MMLSQPGKFHVYRSLQHSFLEHRALKKIEREFFHAFDPDSFEGKSLTDRPDVFATFRGPGKVSVKNGKWALHLVWMCPLFVGTVAFDGDLQAFHADLL